MRKTRLGQAPARPGGGLAAAPPSDRLVAVRAIHRLVGPRRKWHLGGGAALRADGVEHHALAAARAAAIALACAPALGTSGRFVLEPLLCVELLFASRKGEFSAAITAGQVPVCKCHDSPRFSRLGNDKSLRPIHQRRERKRNLARSFSKSNLARRSSPCLSRNLGP